MTTYLDYKANPIENNGPPPVGAPENMPTNQVNNVAREMMSVVRQLGDKGQADIDALGTMAAQDADAVVITGGTVNAAHAGSGALLTALPAAQLTGAGTIPPAIFPLDPPLDVKVARSAQADSLTAAGALQLLPVGTVIMWWGSDAAIPAGWQKCDGTGGTPNLLGKFPLGAGAGVAFGQVGGQFSVNAATDAQGAHAHGGGTAGVALGIEHMPSHSHTEFALQGAGGGFIGPAAMFDGAAGVVANIATQPAGGGAAHAHAIGADGTHAHNVNGIPTTPPYTALWFIMRVS